MLNPVRFTPLTIYKFHSESCQLATDQSQPSSVSNPVWLRILPARGGSKSAEFSAQSGSVPLRILPARDRPKSSEFSEQSGLIPNLASNPVWFHSESCQLATDQSQPSSVSNPVWLRILPARGGSKSAEFSAQSGSVPLRILPARDRPKSGEFGEQSGFRFGSESCQQSGLVPKHFPLPSQPEYFGAGLEARHLDWDFCRILARISV